MGGSVMFPRRRTIATAVPVLLGSVLAAVFVWGQLQPRPPGFAVTAATDSPAASSPDQAAAESAPAPVPTQYTLDARDKVDWTFFDIDSGAVITSTFEDLDWDLALKRTKLLTNSGITNAAGTVGAMDLGELDLDTAEPPGSREFVVDALGGDDGDEPRNEAISRWYNYDFIRHVIVARDSVYLVRTSDGDEALIQFESYYCEDESPGCVTFQYRLLANGDSGGQAAQR
jgi:hypothetical protein